MPNVAAYHRPSTVDEALGLLSSGDSIALAGGTAAVPSIGSRDAVSLVDLQDLGLGGISIAKDRVEIGAMTRLDELMNSEHLPSVVSEAARLELPSALRNQATVGGTVGENEAESVLLAALLAHDAQLSLADGATQSLGDYLAADSVALVTSVNIAASENGTIARTGRTPGDTPIVAAIAAKSGDQVRLVLTGVAESPVLVDPQDPVAGLTPPGDFRGTSEYRTHLAAVLSARALTEVSA